MFRDSVKKEILQFPLKTALWCDDDFHHCWMFIQNKNNSYILDEYDWPHKRV